ncbi:hypothetical protein S7711_11491 [Stachybotrys chartarum IBT 7711]|uniref:Uncharacterized protein n=1 Tax=Stachybotrys chartarum (strain CBS 109288 / IBT 7711) TaxID=1280523 RepID=A0A084B6R0_STACB|nr:hypothetical protein S7711_11491 [Stachybotrys chartarum IBT 7711]
MTSTGGKAPRRDPDVIKAESSIVNIYMGLEKTSRVELRQRFDQIRDDEAKNPEKKDSREEVVNAIREAAEISTELNVSNVDVPFDRLDELLRVVEQQLETTSQIPVPPVDRTSEKANSYQDYRIHRSGRKSARRILKQAAPEEVSKMPAKRQRRARRVPKITTNAENDEELEFKFGRRR